MKKLIINCFFMVLLSLQSFSQREIINLPNLPGYVTLKCDFHTHTVFSDGKVWPTVRIDEAIRDGLDAIAITDHIEYLPNKDFIHADLNAAWKIGKDYARDRNIILVHGAEITRKMPPGHFNALFITDASLIAKDSVWDSFESAIKQGAFLQWNHPGWKPQEPDGIPKLYDIHKKLISKGWIHGIELFNSDFYPSVFNICLKNNITMTGNSDNHGISSERYNAPNDARRPMTLVFSKEKSLNSLKEAMFAGRTLVWFKEILAGKEEFAKPFFYQSISVSNPYFQKDKNIFFEVQNKSAIPFYLENGVPDAPPTIMLAANSITRMVISKKVKTPLIYNVKNILIGEDKELKVELRY